MKKKNLKPLSLNKNSVSNLNSSKLKGGITNNFSCVITCYLCPTEFCSSIDPDIFCKACDD